MHMYMYIYTCIYIYIHTYVRVYIYICIHMYICVRTCVCVCVSGAVLEIATKNLQGQEEKVGWLVGTMEVWYAYLVLRGNNVLGYISINLLFRGTFLQMWGALLQIC